MLAKRIAFLLLTISVSAAPLVNPTPDGRLAKRDPFVPADLSLEERNCKHCTPTHHSPPLTNQPKKPKTTTSTKTKKKGGNTTKPPIPGITPTPTRTTKSQSSTTSIPRPPPTEIPGEATWYETGLGACGFINSNADYIAAVSRLMFDGFGGYQGTNPNNNPICNREVEARFNGKKVRVRIVDRCEACAWGDLDFSPTAFQQLGDLGQGRLSPIGWNFIGPDGEITEVP